MCNIGCNKMLTAFPSGQYVCVSSVVIGKEKSLTLKCVYEDMFHVVGLFRLSYLI